MKNTYADHELNKVDTSKGARLKVTGDAGGETRWISITPDGKTVPQDGYTYCTNPECSDVTVSNDITRPEACGNCDED